MKTTFNLITEAVRTRNYCLAVALLMISLITSASTLISDQEVRKSDDLRDRKLNILEKLEKGTPVKSEEIRSSFSNVEEDELIIDFPVEISHDAIEDMKETIRSSMEDLHHEIGDLKNSDEFRKAMDEIRRGSEELRKEMEKMREELRKSENWSFDWENC
jgi:hypothetical protein